MLYKLRNKLTESVITLQTLERTVGRKMAVLIGINHYLDGSIGNLNFCVNDVEELDSILTNENRGNFSTITLYSGHQDAKLLPNRSNILAAIKLLENNSEKRDTILVYFAGHGFEEKGKNYLLPADARIDVLSETAITLSWIKDTLTKSLAKKKLLVIDACHAGAKLGRATSITMSRSFQEELCEESEGFAVLSSCKIEQVSYDYPEKAHGAFSYFLLEGLKGAADDNNDNVITVPDCNRYVASKMREWSLKTGLQQNPTFSYHVAGDFVFVKVPQESVAEIAPKVSVKEAAKTQKTGIERICELVDDLSFASYEEISENSSAYDELSELIVQEPTPFDKVEKAKVFLKALSEVRFASKYAKEPLMNTVSKCLQMKDVKKWLFGEERIRKFLIIEFVNSYNFDIAGTMARIIEQLLPVFSDQEILYIVHKIRGNDQILASFKARSPLISIVDSCKGLMSFDEYTELRRNILGS